MNASVLVTFTIVMVTALVSAYRVSVYKWRIQYCGTYWEKQMRDFCSKRDFPKIENEEKKDIDEINRRQGKCKLL